MNLTDNDLQAIRAIVREEAADLQSVRNIVREEIAPVEARLMSVENDVKEIYHMLTDHKQQLSSHDKRLRRLEA